MIFLRSALFNLFLVLWTIGLGTVALPLLLGPGRWIVGLCQVWIRGIFLGLRLLCGIRAELRGLANVPPGPVLFASKHQSAWETLYWFIPFPRAAFVLKKELLRIPIFGWYLRPVGHIAIDRDGGAKTLKSLLRQADATLKDGRQVVIFPEGTRTLPGEKRPYQRGIAALYTHCKVPVVPVVLNSGLFWGRNAFRKIPGTVVLEFLPPIPPGESADAFMRRLEQELEAAAAQLCS